MSQGSLDGPTLYGRLAAFMGRIAQSLIPADTARLQLYVDDPILTICATPARTERIIAVVTLAWLTCGFAMAFHKAQRGPRIDWIGYSIADTHTGTRI